MLHEAIVLQIIKIAKIIQPLDCARIKSKHVNARSFRPQHTAL